MLEAAQKYLAQGWSVIPVRNKVPQVKWEEYRRRYATSKELEGWFVNTLNRPGIITGRLSNLSVIDVDGPTSINVQSPVAVKSPKGHHYYFRYQEGLHNYVRVKENVDIRTEGGFVVAPPTEGYIWTNENFTVNDLPPFPIDLFNGELKQPPKLSQTTTAISKIADALKNLKQGNRNDTFTYLTGALHDGHKSSADLFALLRPHAHSCGLTDTELSQIVASVLRYKRETCSVFYPAESDNLDQFKQYMAGTVENTKLSSGLARLDKVIGGFRSGEIYTIGARTGVGKTTYALAICRNLLTRGYTVLLFTTEMSRFSILDRLTTAEGAERYTFLATYGKSLSIIDKSSPKLVDVQEVSREIAPNVIIFDHIQHTGGGWAQTDRENISRFIRGLKDIGNSLGASIIVCSQIRRLWHDKNGIESSPCLSDLKESGTIEEESGVVMLLSNLSTSYNEDKVNILVDVAKNRYGPLTKFSLEFDKKLGTFKELE